MPKTNYADAYILSVGQPHATLLMLGIKGWETRGWATHYRGNLVIHANAKPMTTKLQALWDRVMWDAGVQVPDYLHPTQALGRVLGLTQLKECRYMTQDFLDSVSDLEKALGNWRVGGVGWRSASPQPLERPIPWKGQQGLHPVPPRLAAAMASQGLPIPAAIARKEVA